MESRTISGVLLKNARLLLFGGAVALLLMLGWALDAPRHLHSALLWVDGLGLWGPVVYVLIYILICVLLIPGSILTLGAGAVFGVVRGSIYTSVGSTLGATIAFLVGRFLLRDWVRQRVESSPRLVAVDEAVGREGAKIVFLLRMSPLVPFSISNYVYGLTRVKTSSYVLASWAGMIPGTVMYVYIGSLARRLAELGAAGRSTTPMEWALYVFGLIATIVATARVTVVAKRALNRSVGLDQRSAASQAVPEDA
ncbi:MAG: TVP38/TMEM64 family protein [Spirochaetaceae bacterium]|nr:MAG: TVP38/TMEM64 family protein [Spirochaetaceae bacterium]